MNQRLLNLLIAIDQLAYVLITLGKGYPDETISSAAYRLEQKGNKSGIILRPLIDFLFSGIEKEHCKLAFYAEVNREHLPKQYK